MSAILQEADPVKQNKDFLKQDEIVQFIESEADLLDQGRFRDWLNLFTEDGVYWVPAEPDQKDALSHVSLFYDDYATLKIRIARLEHPRLHCQSPQSRAVRIVSRPITRVSDAETAEARCKFIMVEDRPNTSKRIFAGTYEYLLCRQNACLKMKRKKVILTDCDESFPALAIPF